MRGRNHRPWKDVVKAAGAFTVAILLMTMAGCAKMPEAKRDDVIGTWSYSASESTQGMWGPPAEIELHTDNSLVITDFPLDSLSRSDLYKLPVTSSGTWGFIPRLSEGEQEFEDQSGVEILVPSPGSNGTRTLRNLAVEKLKNGTVQLVLYINFPDIVDDNYVLTKSQ